MKKKIVLILLVAIVGGLTAYGFISRNNIAQNNTEASCNAITNDSIAPDFMAAYNIAPNQNNDLVYTLRARYNDPLTEAQVAKAENLSDLIPHYPEKWIEKYHYASVGSILGDEVQVAKAENSQLTSEQKALLKQLEPGREVKFVVEYMQSNEATGAPEDHRLDFSMTIVPEKEASYLSREELSEFMKQESAAVIEARNAIIQTPFAVQFTINENGDAESFEVKSRTGYPEIDDRFLEILDQMPLWSPALNDKGEAIKQDFEFFFGPNGC